MYFAVLCELLIVKICALLGLTHARTSYEQALSEREV